MNSGLALVWKKINCGFSFDFALKGALCEAAREPNQSSSDLCDSAGSYIRARSAMFFAETEGELTLGSSTAFAAGFVWRGFSTKQSNTPSVRRQTQAADTSLKEGGCKKKSPFIIDRAKDKPLFIISPIEGK